MSRESESEQTQRTVAELLAQYGGSSGEVAPRRRRRRAEDASDTAPQAIIERVNSDSGPMRAIRDEPVVAEAAAPPKPLPQRPSRRAAESPDSERTVYAQPVRPEAPSRPEPRRAAQPSPVVNPAEETTQVPQIVDDFMRDPSRPAAPKPDLSRSAIPKPETSRANLVRPPMPKPPMPKPPGAKAPVVPPSAPPVSMPLPKPPAPKAPAREPVTEQMPRIPSAEPTIRPLDKLSPGPTDSQVTEAVPLLPPAPPALPNPLPDQNPEDWFGDDDDEFAEQEHTAAHPGPYVDDDEDGDDYADNYAVDEYGSEGPAGLSDADEAHDEDEEPERSPAKEWLVMIGQLAVGVLGGAGLWLGFNWLWRSVPAAALVVALAVTVGLVLLVRKIRRADDLQTTVLAVLVGLIVTVSPAAMLLVKT